MRIANIAATAVSALLALAGCGHVPVATMWKLSSLDATTIDPAALRVAVRYPAILAPRPGGAKLTLTTVAAGGGPPLKTTYVLVEDGPGPAALAVRVHERHGDRLSLFKLSPDDVARARLQQQEHRQAAAAGRRGTGNLEAGVDACRNGPRPDGALLASTYLLFEPAQGFLPVVVDIDLRREFGAETIDAQLPPC